MVGPSISRTRVFIPPCNSSDAVLVSDVIVIVITMVTAMVTSHAIVLSVLDGPGVETGALCLAICGVGTDHTLRDGGRAAVPAVPLTVLVVILGVAQPVTNEPLGKKKQIPCRCRRDKHLSTNK